MSNFAKYILHHKSHSALESRFSPDSSSVFACFTLETNDNSINMFKHIHQYFINDMTSQDVISLFNRFKISYLLMTLTNSRILVYKKTSYKLESITSSFASANWLEREIYDMFGVFFENHPDLRRILTDYGFNSFPLRKDFPVHGYYELTYSLEEKVIKIRDLELQQAMRFFI